MEGCCAVVSISTFNIDIIQRMSHDKDGLLVSFKLLVKTQLRKHERNVVLHWRTNIRNGILSFLVYLPPIHSCEIRGNFGGMLLKALKFLSILDIGEAPSILGIWSIYFLWEHLFYWNKIYVGILRNKVSPQEIIGSLTIQMVFLLI